MILSTRSLLKVLGYQHNKNSTNSLGMLLKLFSYDIEY